MAAEHEHQGSTPAHATGAVRFVAVDDISGDEAFRLRPDGDVSQLATSLGRLGQMAPIELRPWPGAASDGPRWQVVAGFRRLAAVRLLARERVLARLHDALGEDDAWGLALGEALLHQPLTGEELGALRARLREQGVAPWAEELVDEALVRAPVEAELRERFHDFLTAAESAAPEVPPVANQPAAAPAAAPSAHSLADASGPPASPSSDPGVPAAAPSARSLADASDGAPAGAPMDGAGRVGASPSLDPGVPPPDPWRGEPGPDGPVPVPVEVVEITPEDLIQDLAIRLSALNQDLATAVEAWKDLPMEGRRLLVEQARYVATLLPFMEAGE